MLKIKLARFGKKHQPHFRIVVNEAKDKRDGKYVALVGHYAPASQPKILEINVDAFKAWIAKGAQPTETVSSLFDRYQSGNPFPARKPSLSKKAKAKAAAEKVAKEAPVEKVSPAATDAPAETAEVAAEATPEVEATPETTETALESSKAVSSETPAA